MIYQTKKEYPGYAFQPFDNKIKDPVHYLSGIYATDESIRYINTDKIEEIVVDAVYKRLYKRKQKTGDDYINIRQHFNEFSNLVIYEDDLPPPDFDVEDTIEFYMKNIPNSDKKPQSYHLWYSIGQTLKNLVKEKKIPEDIGLKYWIDWSKKASKKYTNEEAECKKAWDSFVVRSGSNKYMEGFLNKITCYYYPGAFDKYHKMWTAKKLFAEQIQNFEKYEKYNEQYCRYEDLKDVDGIVIKSGMGTGKTHYVKELAKNNVFKSMIVISPRMSYSFNKTYDFQDVYDKFKDYTEIRGKMFNWLNCRYLAIQFESLKNISHITEDTAYDLVILDESESVLSQVSSTTNGESSYQNFNTLIDLFHYAKKFVIADAYLMQRSLSFAKDVSDICKKKIIYNVNEYKEIGRVAKVLGNAKTLYELPTLQSKFMNHMIKSLKEGKKIVAAVGSKTYMENLKAGILEAMGPDFDSKIRMYSSKSGDDIMNDLKDINKAWADPNIMLVIYTTKITVGVDFNLKDVFDCCYIYGTSTCPIARDLMQSHFRVRHLKDNVVYIALFSGGAHIIKPTFDNEYRKSIFIDNIFHVPFENETNPYMKVTLFNSFEEQVGKFAYDEMFFKLLKDTGYEMRYDDYEVEVTIEMERAKAAAQEGAYIMNYIDIKNLSELKAIDIEKKAKSGKASSLELLQLQAYNFDRFVVKTTKLPKMSNEDIEKLMKELSHQDDYDAFATKAMNAKMTLMQLIETDLYNMYYNKRDIRTCIENVIKEKKCSNIKITIRNNKDSVKATQKEVMKLEKIKHLCSVLGLGSSIDDQTKTTEEKVMAYFTYYKEMPDIEKQIFNENFGIGVLKAKQDLLKAKQLVNLVLKNWNGCGFSRTKKGQNKKGTRFYDYHVDMIPEYAIRFFYKVL